MTVVLFADGPFLYLVAGGGGRGAEGAPGPERVVAAAEALHARVAGAPPAG